MPLHSTDDSCPAVRSGEREAAADSVGKRGRVTRVAVVDDDPEVRELVGSYLSSELGYETMGFSDSGQLEAALDRHRFDLVLLDVMLPDRNGRDVLLRLRSKFSPERLPVIMTTALGKSASIVDCLRLGANDYLVKPLDLAVLAARVSSHLHILELARGHSEGSAVASSETSSAALRICPQCGYCYQHALGSCPDDGQQLQDTPFPLPLRVAERYRLVRRAAQGAMGCVFQAFDERLERTVAVKVLHPELSRDPALRARFDREATASSRLDDSGVVRVYDYGETAQGELFIVMEWLRGMDLATTIKTQGPGSVVQVVRLLVQAARALDSAHRAGLIHRDIKPANIFIEHTGSGWQTRLLDFGVAKELRWESALTLTGGLVGTPMYMAPEQLLFAIADCRSDLYALAVSGYEALTCRLPRSFDGGVAVRDSDVHATGATSLRRYRPDLSQEFDELFLTALAWDPEQRPATASRWAAALLPALSSCLPPGPEWSLSAATESPRVVSRLRSSGSGVSSGDAKTISRSAGKNGDDVPGPAPTRVLMVDDDRETLDLLTELLEREGFSVVACAAAEHAVDLVAREPFDVVLSDVHLDGMSGVELCALLGETNPDLPVVIVTAFGDHRTQLKADAAGVREFIHKPVALGELCAALKRALIPLR